MCLIATYSKWNTYLLRKSFPSHGVIILSSWMNLYKNLDMWYMIMLLLASKQICITLMAYFNKEVHITMIIYTNIEFYPFRLQSLWTHSEVHYCLCICTPLHLTVIGTLLSTHICPCGMRWSFVTSNNIFVPNNNSTQNGGGRISARSKIHMLYITLQKSPEVLKDSFSTSGLIWSAMHSISALAGRPVVSSWEKRAFITKVR